MAHQNGRILPFRIPFFRIFYSTTYTVLFFICLVLLAITPASVIWSAIQNTAFQYIFMVGGVYVLTAVFAIFIYSSRLYTNRAVLAGVGKPYVPIEDGEVGKSVREMIVKQLERSAIVAWEARPRDLLGEIVQAERQGLLSTDGVGVRHSDYTVGRILPVDPEAPPWGHVQHAGWSSPSQGGGNEIPYIHFVNVVSELPNLIEARAVSLAPPDPISSPHAGQSMADPAILELLRRPETMGVRDYLTQISYLGLINPPDIGPSFLHQYENARFGGRPITEAQFASLMSTFSELLSGMTNLDAAITQQMRLLQAGNRDPDLDSISLAPSQAGSTIHYRTPSPYLSESSGNQSPVTARTRPSRAVTPYLQQGDPSTESIVFDMHKTPAKIIEGSETGANRTFHSPSMTSLPSDTGSVIQYEPR